MLCSLCCCTVRIRRGSQCVAGCLLCTADGRCVRQRASLVVASVGLDKSRPGRLSEHGCFSPTSSVECCRVVFRPAATSWRAGDLLVRVADVRLFASDLQTASELEFRTKLRPRHRQAPQAARSAALAGIATARISRRFKSVRRRIAQTLKKAFQGQQLFKHSRRRHAARGPNIITASE